MDLTTWQRLYADVLDDAARLVEHVEPRARRCLDCDTRSGWVAELLMERDASLVWLTDTRPILPDVRRRRFVTGELAWLHRHPRLRADGPDAFDLVVSANGLWRSAGVAQNAVERAACGARALLSPGGVFALTVPAKPAPTTPKVHHITHEAGDVMVMEMQVHGLRHEVRAALGVAPISTVGRDATVQDYSEMLVAAGFDTPTVVPLSGARIGLFAVATAQ